MLKREPEQFIFQIIIRSINLLFVPITGVAVILPDTVVSKQHHKIRTCMCPTSQRTETMSVGVVVLRY